MMNAIYVIAPLIAVLFQQCLSIKLSVSVAIMNEQCQVRLQSFAQAPKAKEIQTLMDIHSIDACIGMCRLEVTAERCSAVAFSVQKTTCILLELGQQFPTAAPADDSFGRYLFEIEGCSEMTDDTTTYASIYPMQVRVPVLLKSCEIYNVESGAISEVSYRAVYQDVLDMESCVLMCEIGGRDECIGVYYTHVDQECRLLEEKPQNTMGYEAEQGMTIAFIQQCSDELRDEGNPLYENIPEEFIEQEEFYLPILQQRCIVEIARARSVKHVYQKMQHDDIDSIENCMTQCLLMDTAECDAVLYLDATSTCLTYKAHQDQDFEIPEDGLYAEMLECYDADEDIEYQPVPEESGQTLDEIVEEELFLQENNEICTLEILPQGQLTGYKELESHSDIGHSRTCLFLCRLVNGIDKCTAFKYKPSSHSCSLLTETDAAEVIPVSKKERAFVVKSCEEARHPDGMFLRKPFKVFLYSYLEICQILPYVGANSMAGWKYIAQDTTTSSFEECVEICRVLRSAGCRAVTFNEQMQCSTLKESVEENSVADLRDLYVSFRVLSCYEGSMTELLEK